MKVARDAGVALAGGALLLLWDLSAADLVAVRWFGTADGFAWRDAWLTRTLLHDGGRVLAWAVLAGLAFDAVRPQIAGPTRAERLRWLAASIACLVAVPALKRASGSSCPWDLQEFGGIARYVSHWSFGVADGGPGHCFPSGHAVAAFAFLPGYFLLRRQRPLAARAWLASVCLTGLLFGGAQLARGAHYPSHTLWSAWLCWLICTLWAWAADAAPRSAPRLRPRSSAG